MLSSTVLVTAVMAVSACGSTSGGQSALEKPSGTTTPSTQGTQTSRGHNIDPIAGPYTPVQRNGSVPTPHIRAHQEPFTKAVRYPDHLTVRILGMRQSVSQGHGPGEIAGRPVTTMRIRFGNDSSRSIDLTQVVVTVVYGSAGRLASPVYDNVAQDFHSVVRPGHSAIATYEFSIPRSGQGDVKMLVDFDGLHAAATFAGPISS